MMPQIETRVADCNQADDRSVIREIREQVFIKEQQVPVELEWDEYDDCSTHFLALADHVPVATARLKPDGQLGRMAVLKNHRHLGIGSALLNYIVAFARLQRLPEVYCHAQLSALDFYRQHSFNQFGETFQDAGITHRAMKIRFD